MARLTFTRLWGSAGRNYRAGETYDDVPRSVAVAALAKGVAFPTDGDVDAVSVPTESDTPDFIDTPDANPDSDGPDIAQTLHEPVAPFGKRPVEAAPEPEAAPVVEPPAPVESPAFVCEDCGRDDFKSKGSLTRHRNVNHPKPEGDA